MQAEGCKPGLRNGTATDKANDEAFKYELQSLDKTVEGGLTKVVAGLAAGRLDSDPFPKVSMERPRDFARPITAFSRVEAPAGAVVQEQPIDVLLLGSVLKALGDPGHDIMVTCAIGVPLGLGVELPRTPSVFPPKTRCACRNRWTGAGSANVQSALPAVQREIARLPLSTLLLWRRSYVGKQLRSR